LTPLDTAENFGFGHGCVGLGGHIAPEGRPSHHVQIMRRVEGGCNEFAGGIAEKEIVRRGACGGRLRRQKQEARLGRAGGFETRPYEETARRA
jgi:hypothetical protein